MALTVERGFPGCRAVATASLSRSTADFSVADTSVIVRDTSVAVSMARSPMPGWEVGVSMFEFPLLTCRCFLGAALVQRFAGCKAVKS